MTNSGKSTFFDELRWRGFLDAFTGDDLDHYLWENRRTMYVGFDPTADSLHLGSLIPVMALAHAQRHGHRPLPLIGGGTGLIGDPSGKAAERVLLTKEKTEHNASSIRGQLSKFLDFSSNDKALMLNNADWLVPLNLVDFLRDIGKYFSVNEMIKRDSVRTRLEERDQGISYTEFSYMLLQAYDFLHLCQHHDCTIQMGGSDQWGNILSGKELVRRVLGRRGEGITFPLLTTANGKKFGKTEDGAVRLDGKRTSAFQMYQYWLQTADADTVRYLRLFTFLDKRRILELEQELEIMPDRRKAQRTLAAECTAIIHGEDTVRTVEVANRILFAASEEAVTAETIRLLAQEVPLTEISRSELHPRLGLVNLLVRTRLAESNGAARWLIEGGGVYLNNRRQTPGEKAISADDLTWPDAVLLRTGKKNHHLVMLR
jgi:tyrosyl-tRNA synthetase